MRPLEASAGFSSSSALSQVSGSDAAAFRSVSPLATTKSTDAATATSQSATADLLDERVDHSV